MAQAPRVVAELGRPETPDETAARKAESSRVHRASQNTRNLIAALLVTLAVVAVIIFGVPRGTPPDSEPIDVTAVAAQVAASEGRPVLSPETPERWLVNRAALDGEESVRAWTIVYAPADEDARGFLRVSQGLDADQAWPARLLAGAGVTEKVEIGGVAWDRYDVDPARSGNVSVAIATAAGPDTILIYGDATDAKLDELAGSVASEVLRLREEAE
jgi:hypothetical protein